MATEDGGQRKALLAHMRSTLRGTFDAGEQEMCETLLMQWNDERFPIPIEAEWDFPRGRGDLVFSNIPSCRYNDRSHISSVVCIIEAKHITRASGRTACAKRRQHRRDVESQVVKAMQAWHERHPNDQVFGATFTNDMLPRTGAVPHLDGWLVLRSRHEWLQVRGEPCSDSEQDTDSDEADSADSNSPAQQETNTAAMMTMEPRISIQLVPQGAWHDNYGGDVPMTLWQHIRTTLLREADHRCQGCQAVHDPGVNELVIHQRWREAHAPPQHALTFVGFDVLCWRCHDVCHLGWAQMRGYERRAMKHLVQHRTDLEDVQQYVQDCVRKWNSSSAIPAAQWRVEDTALYGYACVREWLAEDLSRGLVRFGSVCCKAKYNKQSPVKK